MTSACGRARGPANVPAADLLRHFQDAERRPLQGTFALREHTFAGVSRASLVVPAESRVTWKLFVPHRARLQMHVAFPEEATAAVAVRVGVSDDRIYNTLVESTVTARDAASQGWIPLDADLSLYGGRKWSLFYRPDETKWRIVIATHVLSGSTPWVYLGTPALMTDVEGAREYLRRQTAGSS